MWLSVGVMLLVSRRCCAIQSAVASSPLLPISPIHHFRAAPLVLLVCGGTGSQGFAALRPGLA
jgi:hypothetical protein